MATLSIDARLCYNFRWLGIVIEQIDVEKTKNNQPLKVAGRGAMARAKIAEDEVEYVKKRIWVELKDELDTWVKKRFSWIAFIVAFISIFGPLTVVKMFVGDEVNTELASWRKDIIKVQVDAEKAVIRAQKAAETATESTAEAVKTAQGAVQKAVSGAEAAIKTATESATGAVKAAEVSVQKAVSAAEAATNIAIDKASAAESAAKEALAELDRLRASMAQTTGRLLERRGEISSIRLTEGDKAAILVRQIPRKTGDKTSQGNEWVELDFKLEIDASKTNRSSNEILNQVVKVEYGFDERWFKPPVRTAINPANGFEYSMRVWGVTQVKAVVYISLPDEKGSTAERRTEKIVFEGWMKLDGRGSLKRVTLSP